MVNPSSLKTLCHMTPMTDSLQASATLAFLMFCKSQDQPQHSICVLPVSLFLAIAPCSSSHGWFLLVFQVISPYLKSPFRESFSETRFKVTTKSSFIISLYLNSLHGTDFQIIYYTIDYKIISTIYNYITQYLLYDSDLHILYLFTLGFFLVKANLMKIRNIIYDVCCSPLWPHPTLVPGTKYLKNKEVNFLIMNSHTHTFRRSHWHVILPPARF